MDLIILPFGPTFSFFSHFYIIVIQFIKFPYWSHHSSPFLGCYLWFFLGIHPLFFLVKDPFNTFMTTSFISPYSICIYFRIWKHLLYKSLLNPHHYNFFHVRRLKVLHIETCSKFPKPKMNHARIEFKNMSSKGNFGSLASLAPSLWMKTLSILWTTFQIVKIIYETICLLASI